MAEPLRKVVLIGATGTVGTAILQALLSGPQDAFQITTLFRQTSTSTPPPHPQITTLHADFADLTELTTIFQDHDAVIHASAIPGIASQHIMLQAAVAAGIKRFILNEFANSYEQAGLEELEPFRQPKREIKVLAEQLAGDNAGFSWTGIATGNFLDYSLLKYPEIGIDIKKRTARLVDGGTERFSATVTEDIGLAVKGVLLKPGETANRMCHVRSIETCQKEVLDVSRELVGGEWQVEDVSGKALYERGREAWVERKERKGMIDLLVCQLFEKDAGRSIVATSEGSDNALLGVKERTIPQIVEEVLGKMK